MKIAVLGLGEAGSIYAAGFAATGATVTAYDPATPPLPTGVAAADGVAAAVRDADLVISLVTAAHAVAVAAESAPHLGPNTVYADLNAASPQLKTDVAAALGDHSDRCADVAVIGSVPQFGPKTALIASGPASEKVAEAFRGLGAEVDSIGGEPGDASRRKMLRTVFMKGLGAIISEALDAGAAAGESAWVREQIAKALVGGESALDRLDKGTRKHALRRAHESQAAADLLASLGVAPVMTTATAGRHRSFHEADDLAALLDAFAEIPTAAIGDARERLGVIAPRVQSMWPGAHIAGRAFPVLCRPGDNKGIHQALKQVRPGDVLVVDGGGDPSRALIGELIAHRAINRGVRGMIIDGAVRDVEALQEAGFPVWAVGTSPAGPYKNGPCRVGEDTSVGGVAVHRGDIVVADGDGAIVVPLAEAHRTLTGARAVLDDEAARYQQILSERSA
ncbi:NAD(P)-binding domain-containing protein [Saccharopolyspora sp. TS4A08]|uniref:Putative 4-hydroxy-4-methyl-2-oxoglutarate aldolase n=1 Tax=Saccharopolyspora ipomoeae TaxID=3042027 RepID=A0ABT6PGK4_9PSEU|nr:NAD(P)-binding domain-containing protein [Saccharopolyspora sp. TS4A08]MDI2026985.1 NAD(P)-binding domain-containing protein [Saccharopolyspora sp. TS4A08]